MEVTHDCWEICFHCDKRIGPKERHIHFYEGLTLHVWCVEPHNLKVK